MNCNMNIKERIDLNVRDLYHYTVVHVHSHLRRYYEEVNKT